MKRLPVFCFVLWILAIDLNFGKVPLYFIPNKGQVNKKAIFYAKASRYTLWMTKEGLVFDSVKKVEGRSQTTEDRRQKTDIERDVSRLVFLNANKNPVIVPLEITRHKVNYFIGNDPAKWQKGISTSKVVLYQDIYKNIDLKVYGNENQVEYDWIIKPGGNPGSIRFQYKNVKGTRIDKKGNLFIETKFGELLHKKPVSFQRNKVQGGDVGAGLRACPKERKYIDVTFIKLAENTYGFKVEAYDQNHELIIDPVVSLAYSTYLGGSSSDKGYGIAVDQAGNVYVTGFTASIDFPTQDAFQGSISGDWDGFVTKFNAEGSGLIFSTYFGGSGDELVYKIAILGESSAFVVGTTGSTDLPQAINSFRGGSSDAFICVLNSNGYIEYSRYLGGSSADTALGVVVNGSGDAYVIGVTESTDFSLVNPFQNQNAGKKDAFICKIRPGGLEFKFSTYLGGSSFEYGLDIAVDKYNNFYVTGHTQSPDFPTRNAFQGAKSLYVDGFVCKFEPDGSNMVYSTFLGGSSFDYCKSIAVDNKGHAYVAGNTTSDDFPTKNAYQDSKPGYTSCFVCKLKPDGSDIIYSTYLGGSNNNYCEATAVDNSDCLYAVGRTRSTNFPIKNPYQDTNSGYLDIFISKFKKDGSDLIYSTYLGGGGYDYAYGIAIDGPGNAYVTGYTPGDNFPTRNSYQESNHGGYDAFVSKLSLVENLFLLTVGSTPDSGVPIAVKPLDFYDKGDGETDFTRTYILGTNVTLRAPETFNNKVFYHWSIDGLDHFNRTIHVTMNDNHTVTAVYREPPSIVTLTVRSTPDSGMLTEVTPDDINGNGDGKTEFTRTYNQGELVTLTASETFKGKIFHKWIVDGGDDFNRSIQVTMVNNHTVTAVYQSPAVISLNRIKLCFGADTSGAATGAQTFFINNNGEMPLDWTVSDNASWLTCSPTSGTDPGEVTVSVDATGLAAGTYNGTITVSAPNASNSPQYVNVTMKVYKANTTGVPFGFFETPGDGAYVYSSIPVTGWTLDDIEVMSVKIYRQEDKDLVYIGDAVFVDGARPDVELAFPNYPKSYRAGWGYMMLTNFLPNGGNGTFTIHAIATDKEGHQVTLGTKTIHCDNVHAVKPFGAIDTPTQGGTASGSNYRNQGWALTPMPNKIPEDAHTIIVWIDGVSVGNPIYNIYRKDIASLFPGYANSNGAMAYFDFDTTTFKNGVHTVQWTAVDNDGNVDGIGSRYFSIQNTGGSAGRTAQSAGPSQVPFDYSSPIRFKKGYNQHIKPHKRFPDETGNITIEIKELERIEIHLSEGTRGLAPLSNFPGPPTNNRMGFLVVGDQLRTLPIGSTFNPQRGIFSWIPGPGFVGIYRFIFLEKKQNRQFSKTFITVSILPKFTGKIHPVRH